MSKPSPKIKARIAPSPTGNLHLGTVRTALYNVLLAKHEGGDFYFRLEDTDRERSKEEFTQEIIDGFNWLGIKWDKPSKIQCDPLGFVRQSTQNAIHTDYVTRLLAEKKAYKCFATEEELKALREFQEKNHKAMGYDNRGRKVSYEDQAQFEAEGKKFVVRLNLGADHDLKWNDVVRGEMSINSKDLGGDPVIQKFNGQVLYNFAVVIDDHEMDITHVFRGEDHLTNTAKQIAIYEALGFSVPVFGHLPLIFTPNKEKLSKRKHGDIAGVEMYKRKGYLPEALVNYLIAMSYTRVSEDGKELYSIEEATKDFDTSRLSKSSAIYDINKLNWYNREYIVKFSHEELLEHLKPFLKYDLSKLDDESQRLLINGIRGNLNNFSEINENINYFFDDVAVPDDLKSFVESGKPAIQELHKYISGLTTLDAVEIKNAINKIGENLGIKGKNLFWPIRIALSSRSHGPDLGEVVKLLGKERALERLTASLRA